MLENYLTLFYFLVFEETKHCIRAEMFEEATHRGNTTTRACLFREEYPTIL